MVARVTSVAVHIRHGHVLADARANFAQVLRVRVVVAVNVLQTVAVVELRGVVLVELTAGRNGVLAVRDHGVLVFQTVDGTNVTLGSQRSLRSSWSRVTDDTFNASVTLFARWTGGSFVSV